MMRLDARHNLRAPPLWLKRQSCLPGGFHSRTAARRRAAGYGWRGASRPQRHVAGSGKARSLSVLSVDQHAQTSSKVRDATVHESVASPQAMQVASCVLQGASNIGCGDLLGMHSDRHGRCKSPITQSLINRSATNCRMGRA